MAKSISSRTMLDDDTDGFSSSSSPPLPLDIPDFNSASHNHHPDLVLYSSDLSIPPGGGLGSGGSGGTTSSGNSTVVNSSGSGLTFNLTWDSSVSTAPSTFKVGVLQVAQYYANHFTDPVTLNINVGYGEAGGSSLGGALGMSLTNLQSSSYTQIKNALTADKITADDTSSVSSLQGDPTTHGNYWVTTAQAKALGLLSSTTNTDGSIGFSSSSGIFDYNNSDGVASTQYDFFAVVAHEFSEVMGRLLLVGTKIGTKSNSYDALDLFHYSAPGTHDLSGSVAGYFSVNNGVTDLHDFNVSPSGGDRGDWASSATPDAFDAFGTKGVAAPISPSDLATLDVIGWNPGSFTPPVVTAGLVSDTGSSSTDLITSNGNIAGTGNANAIVHFTVDGQAVAPTATADINGAWTFNPANLADGQHTIVASETTSGGATGSSSLTYTLDTKAPVPSWTELVTSGGVVTLAGSTGGSAGESLSIYDGNILVGTGTTGTGGSFGFTSPYEAGVQHVGSVVATDVAGNVGTSAGNAYLGSTGTDTIVGSPAADLILGSDGADSLTGGGGKDTFIYCAASDSPPSAADTITDFVHGVDMIDFTNIAGINATNGVPQFQGNIAATGNVALDAHSVGFIELGGNTWVVANTSNNVETVAADMHIMLVGVGLGLTAADFHHS